MPCTYICTRHIKTFMGMVHPTCAMILVSTLLLISLHGGGGGGFTLAAPSSSSSSSSSSLPAVPVFIFGDSLSDVGNNNYLPFTVLKSNFLPYGVDYGSSSSKRTPTGRFSNGRLVLDIIGIHTYIPYIHTYTCMHTYIHTYIHKMNDQSTRFIN